MGEAMLVDEITSEKPETNRFYWNHSPVVALFFNEPLVHFNESLLLITVDHCDIVSASHTIENDQSIIHYSLSNCEEGPIRVDVVDNIVLQDNDDNLCVSHECISNFPLLFETDYTAPNIIISTVEALYGSEMDVSFEISEPDTTFTCNSIGIAVEKVNFVVTQVDKSTCHYSFTPEPVNGTYILLSVPAGRFVDKALNPNVAFKPFGIPVLNKGAQISVVAPTFTNMMKTEFTLSLNYTWLCPNYEHLFPSTFQYDRTLAHIEKNDEGQVVDGTFIQTFSITFLNFDATHKDRHRNIPIYIPSRVCINPLGLYNQGVTFYMTFDNTHTVPSVTLLDRESDDKDFTVDITFNEVRSFGEKEPKEYVVVSYANQTLNCNVTRHTEAVSFTYRVKCPLNEEGNVNVTILDGAVVEVTGTPSQTFSKLLRIDRYPPMVVISFTKGNTFGPDIIELPMLMNATEVMTVPQDKNSSCFGIDHEKGIKVQVSPLPSQVANWEVMVTMIRLFSELQAGSFNIYIKEHCMKDEDGNYNVQSNNLTFYYDFTTPNVTLNCPSSTVWRSMTITGTMDEPCHPLTEANIVMPDENCSIDSGSLSSTETAFSFTVSCSVIGNYQFGLRGVKDLVGNEARIIGVCNGNFTVNGPRIDYEIRNLVNDRYINTPSFTIYLSVSSCASMNLTENNVIVENVKNLQRTRMATCQWRLTGSAEEDGRVLIRVLSGAAIDIYGAPSLSLLIDDFFSYQAKPEVTTISRSLLPSGMTSDVYICYDTSIVRGEGHVLTDGGCSDASVDRVEGNCVYMQVAVTTGERCYLYLEEDLVKTAWELSSVGRYVWIGIDDHPPALNVVASIDDTDSLPVPDATDSHKQHFYLNGNFVLKLAVASSCRLDLEKLDLGTATLTAVSKSSYLEIPFTFDSDADKDIQITMNEGLLTDSFGRKNERMVYMIHYSKAIAVVSVEMTTYSSKVPITASVSFDKDVYMTAKNVISMMNFTFISTNARKYELAFEPEVEGMYTFELQNIKTIFGNPVDNQSYSFYYYTEQPTLTNTIPEIETTTSGNGRDGLIQMFFSHHMADLSDTSLDDMFVSESGSLSEYFDLVSATVNETEVSVKLTPKSTSGDYYRFLVRFNDNAFVDRAGNTAVSANFTLIIDNRPPTVTSVLHNGGAIFSRLPLSLVITFSRPVVLAENFASMVSASSGDVVLSFSSPRAKLVRELTMPEHVTEVTLVSVENDIPLTVGMEWSVTVEPGIAKDEYGVVIAHKNETTMTVTDRTLTLETIGYGAQNTSSVMLTFDKEVYDLKEDKLTLVNADIKEWSTEGKVLNLSLECATQGEWSIHFDVAAVEGIDGSLTTEPFDVKDKFDNMPPIVTCEVPPTIGAGQVNITCNASEPIQKTSSIFSVVRDSMVLVSTETLSEDRLTLWITFVAVETYSAGESYSVVITLDDCRDDAGNACSPVQYITMVDFTPILVKMSTSRDYLHNNETVTVTADFSKPIIADSVDLVMDYDDDLITLIMELDSMDVAHLSYSWVIRVMSTELTSDIVPIYFEIPAGVVNDKFGNVNEEGLATVYLNELSPELFAGCRQNENMIEVNVTVQNGPLGPIDAEMFELSENIHFDKVVSIVSDNSLMPGSWIQANLMFIVTCETSCSYSIRFLHEKIFNLAGNQMEEDLLIDGIFVRAPVVSVNVKPYYSAELDQLEVSVSERSDIYCQLIQFNLPEVEVQPKSCLNALECICTVNFGAVTEMSKVSLTFPAHSISNAYHVSNENTVEVSFYYSPAPTMPLFSTQWDEDQPVVNIDFTVSAGSPGVNLTENMIQCSGCEVLNWTLLDTEAEIMMYSFLVSFLDDQANYVRVYIEAATFIDPFGRPNLASEKVLRRDAEAVTIQQVIYSEKRDDVLELVFSKPVYPCGGNVALTCLSNHTYTYYRNSQQNEVRYSAQKVYISLLPYGDLDYEVSWDETAFCDSTNYPVATECTDCTFHSAPNVPTPPLLSVEDVTAHNATIHYMITHDGGEPVLSAVAYVMPGADLAPAIFRADAATGEILLTGLNANTNYRVTVLLRNVYGYSMPSAEQIFLTAPSTPVSASDLRICDMVNPTKIGDVYVYSEAEACWTPSPTNDIFYRLELSALIDGVAQDPVVMYEGVNTTAIITVPDHVTSYRLTLTTVTMGQVEEGEDSVSVSADFVTEVNRENVEKFPQGVGIVAVAERLTESSVRVSFTHPLENYFRIERYEILYGNVDDRTVTAVSLARESYEFLMDKCVSDQVILTVRAVVRDDFGGIPSNRVVVYCKKPRLQLVTDVGYDYVAFRVTSEVATTVTCSLKSQFSAEILATRALKVHPVNVAPYQLFKSLYPDTEYTIECFGYDLDFN